MMVLKKKTIIILTLVVLIVAAGYISTKYGRAIKVNENEQTEGTGTIGKDSAASSSNVVAQGYFIDAKLGRENTRTAEKQDLMSVIENESTSKEIKKEAEEKYMDIMDREEKEMIIENLIKSKNYEDAVVLLSGDSANVTVRTKSMTPDQVNILKNIVCRESKLPANKVMIQPKE
jgi:stage III sporulation protein AH